MAAINQICGDKNVAPDQVLEAVKQAIATAYRKDYGNKEQEIRVVLREDQDMPSIMLVKEIVEEVENENFEILLADATKLKPDAKAGEEIEIEVTPPGYGRIAAQSAKQVILQKIHEAEKQAIYQMFKDREDECSALSFQSPVDAALLLRRLQHAFSPCDLLHLCDPLGSQSSPQKLLLVGAQ